MKEKSFIFKTLKFWKIISILYLLILLFFICLNIGIFGDMPSISSLKNQKKNTASEIYSSDSTLIGKIYSHNRVPCNFNELPDNLVNALLATEDSRFYTHCGIDPKALLAVVKGIITGDNRGGGSTITQQLAKNLFPRGKVNKLSLLVKKLKEWIIAIKLERNYTKHEIISSYFNTVEFSDNAFGVKSAAKTYFNKDVSKLTVIESAVLVGMLKAPYKYNPRIHPKASLERRNIVLSKMLEHDFITQKDFDKYKVQPIRLDFNKSFNVEGVAPYFVSYVTKYLKKYFINHPLKDGTEVNIYGDGLKIYTTIDLKMQKLAEEAVSEHLTNYQKKLFSHWQGGDPWHGRSKRFLKHIKSTSRYIALKNQGMEDTLIYNALKQKLPMKIYTHSKGMVDTIMSPWDSVRYYKMFLQTGFLAIDPKNGYVKAWVGGANYDHFKYDHVNIGCKRQVGSVFKPFLYAVAVEQKGFSPCHRIPNTRIVFRPGNPKWKLGASWSPSNSGGGYGGMPTLKQALSKSLNTVSARLMYEVGPTTVIQMLRNLGIDSSTKIPPYPSICLGTPEISVFEMVGAYTAFANMGLYTSPTFITKVDDINGNTIFESFPTFKEVMNSQVAYVMQDMMKGVVDVGTAKRLKASYNLKGNICGKTGTTQSNADGWFIGLTPNLIAGVWVGCDDRLVRFRSTGLGQGAAMALPIWGKFFNKISNDPDIQYDMTKDFEKPEKEDITIETDCKKYVWGKSTIDEKKVEITKAKVINKTSSIETQENYDNEDNSETPIQKENSKPINNNSTPKLIEEEEE